MAEDYTLLSRRGKAIRALQKLDEILAQGKEMSAKDDQIIQVVGDTATKFTAFATAQTKKYDDLLALDKAKDDKIALLESNDATDAAAIAEKDSEIAGLKAAADASAQAEDADDQKVLDAVQALNAVIPAVATDTPTDPTPPVDVPTEPTV